MPKILENIKETLVNEGRNVLQSKNYKELNIREASRINWIRKIALAVFLLGIFMWAIDTGIATVLGFSSAITEA